MEATFGDDISIMLNREQNAKECDATDDDSSNEAGFMHSILRIKKIYIL